MAPKPRYQELVEKVKKLEGEVEALRKTEAVLRESQERYRSLFDHAADLIAVVDLDGHFLDLNERFEVESGYTRKEMIGKNAFTSGIMTPQSAELAQSNLLKMRDGEPWMIFEIEGVRKDGTKIPFELRAAPLKRDGEIVGFQAILRDVQERKRVMQVLQESEEKYRHLLNHAPAGIYEVDYWNQKFVTVNDVMCEYTGYAKEEFLSLSPLEILSEESRNRFLQRIAKISAGEKIPETVEYQIRAREGSSG